MNAKSTRSADYALGFAAGALYTRTEQAINTIVAEAGGTLSGQSLAFRLGELLLSKASGELLRTADSLLALRGAATKVSKVRRSKMEVAGSSRAHSTLKKKRKGLSPQARYWAKMTPLQRRREMIRRGMVGKKSNVVRMKKVA
jgi:hypothetical protein